MKHALKRSSPSEHKEDGEICVGGDGVCDTAVTNMARGIVEVVSLRLADVGVASFSKATALEDGHVRIRRGRFGRNAWSKKCSNNKHNLLPGNVSVIISINARNLLRFPGLTS